MTRRHGGFNRPPILREQGVDEACGCGSGLLYGACCKKLLSKMLVDENGDFIKELVAPPELQEVLDRNRIEFSQIFGRSPSADDRVMFSQFLHTRQEFDSEFSRAAKLAGIAPAVLYATQKTGLIVGESSGEVISTADRMEWDAAIEEYYEALEDGIDLLEPQHPRLSRSLEDLAHIARHAPIHFGSYLTKIRRDRRLTTPEFCQSLVLSRVHELLISFFNQLNANAREEIFIIIRALYECYLIMTYLDENEDHAETLLAQGFVGGEQYEFKLRKDGLPDRRVIVDKVTGREFPAHTSFYKMAEHSPISEDLIFFDVYYESLSRHVHFSLANIHRYFDHEAGFAVDKETDFEKALIVGFAVVKMLCDAVVRTSLSTQQIKRDARYLGKKIRSAVLEFLKAAKRSGVQIAPEIEIVRNRLQAEFRR